MEEKEQLFVNYLYKVLEAENKEDFENKLKELDEEEISLLGNEFDKEYTNMESELEAQKKQLGGKLNYISKLKAGGKMKGSDCPCGKYKMVKRGGKLVEECACGGTVKNQNGGSVKSNPKAFNYKMKKTITKKSDKGKLTKTKAFEYKKA